MALMTCRLLEIYIFKSIECGQAHISVFKHSQSIFVSVEQVLRWLSFGKSRLWKLTWSQLRILFGYYWFTFCILRENKPRFQPLLPPIPTRGEISDASQSTKDKDSYDMMSASRKIQEDISKTVENVQDKSGDGQVMDRHKLRDGQSGKEMPAGGNQLEMPEVASEERVGQEVQKPPLTAPGAPAEPF